MIGFEVHVNGELVCIAAIGSRGVLSAIVSWVGGSRTAPNPAARTRQGQTNVRVGGLRTRGDRKEFVEWFDRVLTPGDEVSFRVVEAKRGDAPGSIRSYSRRGYDRFVESGGESDSGVERQPARKPHRNARPARRPKPHE